MRYFSGIKSVEDAKSAYIKWAKELHPDNFQDDKAKEDAHAQFVEMKAQYEELLARLTTKKTPGKSIEKKLRKKLVIKMTADQKNKIASTGSKFAGAVAEAVTHSVFTGILERIETR